MKVVRIISIALLLFLGIGAIYGGYSLISDPTGYNIKLPFDWIKGTIFKNYFIPGLVLFVMNGLMGLTTAFVTIFRWKYYAGFVLLQGITVVLWIVVQWFVIQHFFWLQFVFFGIGVILMIFGILLEFRISNKQIK